MASFSKSKNSKEELSDIDSEILSRTNKPDWMRLDHKYIENNRRDKILCIKNSNLYREAILSKSKAKFRNSMMINKETLNREENWIKFNQENTGSSVSNSKSKNSSFFQSNKTIKFLELKKKGKKCFLPDLSQSIDMNMNKSVKSVPKGIMEKLRCYNRKKEL